MMPSYVPMSGGIEWEVRRRSLRDTPELVQVELPPEVEERAECLGYRAAPGWSVFRLYIRVELEGGPGHEELAPPLCIECKMPAEFAAHEWYMRAEQMLDQLGRAVLRGTTERRKALGLKT